jgi:hypothetical protein
MTHDNEQFESDDILRLRRHLGDDTDFYPSDSEVEQLMARVDRAIEADQATVRIDYRLRNWIGMAAAVVLMISASLIGFRYGRDSGATAGADTVLVADASTMAAVEEQQVALDYDQVTLLIQDFAGDYSGGAAERLLDDLTDDEMIYLEQTFDVGDLL